MQTQAVLDREGVRYWTRLELWPALGVLLFGVVVLYTVSFSPLPFAHNATHDARHANGFPCH